MLYINIIVLFVSLTMICFYARCLNFLRSFFYGAFSGILALGTTILVCPEIIKFNFFTIIITVLAGAPGVVLEILTKQFLIV